MADNKFFSEWETVHNKGLLLYLFRNIFPSLMGILFTDFIIFLIERPLRTETINTMIYFCVNFIFFCIVIYIVKWYRSEQRYKEIANLRKGATYERNHEEM